MQPAASRLSENRRAYPLSATDFLRAGQGESPGGDRIHYQAANPGDVWARFVVVMACTAGEEMFVFVEVEELEARKHLRHPGPVVDPWAQA